MIMSAISASSSQCQIQNTIISLDNCLDYCPFISFFSNTINVITKIALAALSRCTPSLYDSVKDEPLVKHFENKHAFVCVLMMIPIFNIFVAFVRHNPKTQILSPPSPRYDRDTEALLRQMELQKEDMSKLAEEAIKKSVEASKRISQNLEASKVNLKQRHQKLIDS